MLNVGHNDNCMTEQMVQALEAAVKGMRVSRIVAIFDHARAHCDIAHATLLIGSAARNAARFRDLASLEIALSRWTPQQRRGTLLTLRSDLLRAALCFL